MKCAFIEAHRPEFSIRSMCRMLMVHFSGFYAWLKELLSLRAQEDARQTDLIQEAWADSGKVYGYRKLHDDLLDAGETCSENSVARLASLAGKCLSALLVDYFDSSIVLRVLAFFKVLVVLDQTLKVSFIVHTLHLISVTNPPEQITDHIPNVRFTGVQFDIHLRGNAVLFPLCVPFVACPSGPFELLAAIEVFSEFLWNRQVYVPFTLAD